MRFLNKKKGLKYPRNINRNYMYRLREGSERHREKGLTLFKL